MIDVDPQVVEGCRQIASTWSKTLHALAKEERLLIVLWLAEGDCSVRVHTIAEHVHLSQSALSRVIDRLEKHGLVRRGTCENDRRAIYAELTDEGRDRYEAARPTHREVLERELS